jgi:hypothetical protein
MVSLIEIENKLNLIIGDRDIQVGMCKPMKNRYYNINDEFLVVEFKHDRHIVFSNDMKSRELLSGYVWFIQTDGYACNNNVGLFHKNYLNYADELVADHINRLRYDNRFSNLRVVTVRQNCRNKTKRTTNTSGKNGVSFNPGMQAWVARIYNNNNEQIKKSFSVSRYGDEQAKRLAIEQRIAWQHEFNYEGE